MTRTLRAVAFVLASLSLIAAACSASASSAIDGAATNEADGAPTSDNRGGEVEPGEAGETGETKTLDEYLGVAAGFARGGGAVGGARGAGGGLDDEQQRLIEQQTQICMQAQGFEYTPEELTAGVQTFLAQANQSLSTEEFAATEGFGISTGFDALLEGDIDFGDNENANDLHLESLSEAEADAWRSALQGEPPQRNSDGQLVDPETGEVVQGRGRQVGGCSGEARTEVLGDFSVLSELQDDFEELDLRIAGDPRIAEIARSWADCIRQAGFGYETEDEARADIQGQFRPLLFSFFGRGQGQQDGGQGGQGQGGQQGNPFEDLVLSAEQEAELQAIQDQEIAIAIASVACQDDTGDEVAEITARYEAEFVEANRATLESIAG